MTITQARTTPTWTPVGLRCLVERYAATHADRLDLALSVAPADQAGAERSYTLLELTDDIEIWAIRWPSSQGLEFHDHGGSAGALWVLSGELVELAPAVDATGGLTRRTARAGSGISFGADHVHAVHNERATPATSIHAYSPPMHSMTFYEPDPASGWLVPDRTQLRFDDTWTP